MRNDTFSIQHHGRLSSPPTVIFPSHSGAHDSSGRTINSVHTIASGKGKGKAENCFFGVCVCFASGFQYFSPGIPSYSTTWKHFAGFSLLLCALNNPPLARVFVSSSSTLLRCAKEWIIKGIYTFSRNDTKQRIISSRRDVKEKTLMRGHKVAASS